MYQLEKFLILIIPKLRKLIFLLRVDGISFVRDLSRIIVFVHL